MTGHCICVNWALTSSLKTINAALNPLNKGIFLFSSWFTQVIIIRLVVYRQLIKDTSEAKEKGALGKKRSRYIDSLYSKFWFLIPYENISVVLNLDIKWFVMLFYWQKVDVAIYFFKTRREFYISLISLEMKAIRKWFTASEKFSVEWYISLCRGRSRLIAFKSVLTKRNLGESLTCDHACG